VDRSGIFRLGGFVGALEMFSSLGVLCAGISSRHWGDGIVVVATDGALVETQRVGHAITVGWIQCGDLAGAPTIL